MTAQYVIKFNGKRSDLLVVRLNLSQAQDSNGKIYGISRDIRTSDRYFVESGKKLYENCQILKVSQETWR